MFNYGGLADPRTDEERSQDWTHEELASASLVEWKEKPQSNWKLFETRNQVYSSSCMAHSGVKISGIDNFTETGEYVSLSAKPVYSGRFNKPGEGMYQQDCLSLLSKPTACLESQLPSNGLNEQELNEPFTVSEEMKASAEKYRANGYLTITNRTIDAVASVIAQGKGVQIMIFFKNEEYAQNVPQILYPELKSTEAYRHGVAATDFFIYNGKKALLIEDSAGIDSTIDKKGWRIITEDFFNARCFSAGYLINKKNEGVEKPVGTFRVPVQYGDINSTVELLQQMLQYEGFLVTHIDGKPLPLGKFYAMTAQALKKWQIAHGILDFQYTTNMKKIRFGPKSISTANALYAPQ